MSEVKLYHGDCLEVMGGVADKSVDLILTDPPYGTTACKWDSVIPFDKMWEQYNRVIKVNGAIVLFGSQPFTTKLIYSNIKNFSHQWIWDKGMSANPFLCNKMPLKNFEDICVFYQEYDLLDDRRKYFEKVLNFINKSKTLILKECNQGLDHCFRFNSEQFAIPTEENYNLLIKKYKINEMNGFLDYKFLIMNKTYNPQMIKLNKKRKVGGGYFEKDGFIGKNETEKRITEFSYPTAILKFSNRKGKGNTFHPTQKPIALLEYLIKTYTNENEIVLDNCMGSGSTGVACINTNRNFIGIELDDDYFKIAEDRIEAAKEEK